MDEKFDKAIENVLAMVRANCKPEDAMKFTQSALNLAHAKVTLAGYERHAGNMSAMGGLGPSESLKFQEPKEARKSKGADS